MLIAVYILLALLTALVVFNVIVAWKLSNMLLHPRIYAYDTVVDEEVKRGHFTREWYDANVHLEDFTLRSPYGYDLHCALWPREEGVSFAHGRRRVVVLVHGFTYCLLGQIKYAAMFHDLGFDCVLYDHRNHGLSGRAPTTMGAFEAQDLAFICDWARTHYGEGTLLGTLGESMGAATVMLHAGMDSQLSFVVEDCGYSSLTGELKHELKNRFHLPTFPVLPIASLFFRLRGGVFFGEVRPADALGKNTSTPMLFVHGDADELVPPAMQKECFDAKPDKKTMWLVPGAPHAGCYASDPAGYREQISRFLAENSLID